MNKHSLIRSFNRSACLYTAVLSTTGTPVAGIKCVELWLWSMQEMWFNKTEALFAFPDCCVELVQGDEPDGVQPRQE